MPPTREQQMATKAYECVERIEKSGKKNGGTYLQFAQQLPALIHACGLAQTIAFALAKEHENVANDLAKVLGMEAGSFHAKVRGLPAAEYMRLSRQALSAATWIKRYAEVLLEKDKTATNGGN